MYDRRRKKCWTYFLLLVFGCALVLSKPLTIASALTSDNATLNDSNDPYKLQTAFTAVAYEFGIPERVLLAVGYNVSRWDTYGNASSRAGGYGPMHLIQISNLPIADGKGLADNRPATSKPDLTAFQSLETLDRAAQLLGSSPDTLKNNPVENIRGGAALLRRYVLDTTGAVPTNEADWYGAVAKYSNSQESQVALDFANAVYRAMQQGITRITNTGQQMTLAAGPVTPNMETVRSLHLRSTQYKGVDCPPSLACTLSLASYQENTPTDPTDYGNFDLADRPAHNLAIQYIVIHDTETDYATTLQVFQIPTFFASAHYVVRSTDGHVAQIVRNKNVAWHAGNWYINSHAIGIEHEGVAIGGASWYSEQMYRASATLVRYLALKYGVPLDRAHIIGHDEIPGPTPGLQASMHWDPGPFWDWDHYMELLGAPSAGRDAEQDPSIITIQPNFRGNKPPLTYCYNSETSDCHDVPSQAANFVYLHTAPDPNASLITNPYIETDPTRANNWANKAVTGQQFYRADSRGDWDAIFFGGQLAWFYNPSHRTNTTFGTHLLVTPKAGLNAIPVYGRAYPEDSAYPTGVTTNTIVPIYTMPAGQVYVATDQINGNYYSVPVYTPTFDPSHLVVTGQTVYYRIFFNHRFAFVKASDVDTVAAPIRPLPRSIHQSVGG